MINNNKKINKRVKQLIEAVSRYIEENYIEIQSTDECTKAIEPFEVTVNECCEMYVGSAADQSEIPAAPMAVHAKAAEVDSSDLTEMLENLDAGFFRNPSAAYRPNRQEGFRNLQEGKCGQKAVLEDQKQC